MVSKTGTAIHRLGIVADLHCGSRHALIPPDYWPAGSKDVQPTAALYEYLWSQWLAFIAWCPPLDVLLVNGDTIEGEAPSSRAVLDAITDDMHEQALMAIETLRPLVAKAKQTWLVRGTAWHEGRYYEALEHVGTVLNAAEWAPGRHTGLVWDAEWMGLRINAVHAMSKGAIYYGTVADRTTMMSAAAEALDKADGVDLIIRSHLHTSCKLERNGRWFLATPGFKAVDQYGIERIEYWRAVQSNDIGAVVLEIHDDSDGRRQLCWSDFKVRPFRWKRRAVGATHTRRRSTPRRIQRAHAATA